jgi:hypothetical protein
MALMGQQGSWQESHADLLVQGVKCRPSSCPVGTMRTRSGILRGEGRVWELSTLVGDY